MKSVTAEERRQRLGSRQWLAASAPSVEVVAADLVGLHATDPVTVFLSCRARVEGFQKADLETSLYVDRSLVRLLGMRRTLFVTPRYLASSLQSGCAQRYVAAERKRLTSMLEDQHDVSSEWLNRVEERTVAALEDLGEATARQLVAEVPELSLKLAFGAGKKWGGEIGLSTRVLFLLSADGRIVRGRPVGTWISSQYQWVLRERWVESGWSSIDPAAARAELARRWLGSYGPASFDDLKWWSGWGVAETRRAAEAAGAVDVDLDGDPGLELPDDSAPAQTREWVAFLPSLDPTPMGWKHRDWFLGNHQSALYDRNGNIGPTVWLNGRIIGGWATTEEGDVRYGLLEPVNSEDRALMDVEAAALSRWLDGTRVVPRFRTPLEKRLTS